MKELKFVVASDNGKEIRQTHFGDAERYYIYKVLDKNEVVFEKVIENNFKDVDESTEHGSKEKRTSVISLLGKEIDFIVSNKMSPNFKRINSKTRVCPIVSEIINFDELFEYIKNSYTFFSEVKFKKNESQTVDIIRIRK